MDIGHRCLDGIGEEKEKEKGFSVLTLLSS